MRWWGRPWIPIVAVACSDAAKEEPPLPSVSVGGLTPDGQLPACVWEPAHAEGAFALRNDGDVPATAKVSYSGGRPVTLNLFPRAVVEVPFVVPVEAGGIGVTIVWEGGRTESGSLRIVPTVDTRLIELQTSRADVLGGPVAQVVVKNLARVPARVELEADPGIRLTRSVVDLPLLGLELVQLEILEPKLAWYARDAVRVRSVVCGDGTAKQPSTSLSPFSADIAKEIAAGRNHTCARGASGAVVCWGDNSEAQLARPVGTWTESSADPLVVSGLESGVSQLAAGWTHTCALRDGKVLCWGGSRDGQCGIWTNGRAGSPREVALPGRAVAIFAGANASCARLDDSTLYCWGRLVGASPTTVPVKLDLLGVREMAMSHARWCAVGGDGALRCWGKEPGDGSASSTAPVIVSHAIDHVVAGDSFTCGLHHGDDELPTIPPDSVVCWGESDGKIETLPRLISADVQGIVRHLSAGGLRVCRAGETVACGSPFGLSTEAFAHPLAALASGAGHTCSIFDGGKIACVGARDRGQTGTQTVSGNVAGFDGP